MLWRPAVGGWLGQETGHNLGREAGHNLGWETGHNLGRSLAVAAIRAYQRWISPYKGYVCAHRQLHGGLSCSEFARRSVLKSGVWRAMPGIRNQFGECGEAARHLRQRRREAMLAAAGASEHAGVLAMARGGSAKRSLEERMHEDSEKKRKRLNELQGDNPWWVGPEWWDGCGVPGPCAAMGCFGSIFSQLPSDSPD